MRKLLLIGGGGHCHSVLDSVLSMGLFDVVGIVDNNGHSFLGVKVVGSDDDIPHLLRKGWTEAFITVGSVGNTNTRRKTYDLIKHYGIHIVTIIDPTATIARATDIAEGVFVGKHAIINTGTVVHKCAIINSGVIVEHDCEIGEFSHISPGVVLCGDVSIASDTHVGAGSILRQQIKIGNNTIIGAGSAVVKNIPANVKAYGNPCRVVE